MDELVDLLEPGGVDLGSQVCVDNVPREADESENRHEPMPVLVWESGVGVVGSGRRGLVGEGSDPMVPVHVAERTPSPPKGF